MRESWDRRIRRAEQLAATTPPAASLLAFYARLLRSQKAIYETFDGRRLSGSPDRDVALMRGPVSALLHEVSESGPDQLVVEARTLLEMDESATGNILLAYWRAPSDRLFFPKAILQPYAERLVDTGGVPIVRVATPRETRCPFCGGIPQLSILDPVSGSSADSGGRRLLCATCLSTWAFRRVLCAHCGEEDEHKLCYFHSPGFDHLRIDACESCRHYLKSVDLGRLGLAVPLVDEVAGAPLDIWAREHGYQKIELNLVGL